MSSWESMKECIGPFIREVAQRVRRSASMVYKWTEPSEDFTDSGARNPAELLDEIIDEAKRRGRGDLALAPLRWLNMEHGLVAIKLPEATGCTQVNATLIGVIKEFADLASVTSESLGDNRISPSDWRNIEREGEEAIRAIITLLHIAKGSVT